MTSGYNSHVSIPECLKFIVKYPQWLTAALDTCLVAGREFGPLCQEMPTGGPWMVGSKPGPFSWESYTTLSSCIRI